MITEAEWAEIRSELLHDPARILDAEHRYMNYLVGITLDAAESLFTDFDRANDLLPFWIRYAPQQRGRAPTGESIPWSEVGEKSLSSNIIRAISLSDLSVSFPGLPFGGDVRFATDDAIIHFDVKMTGPHDKVTEVVVPPYQVSGDGAIWEENGVISNTYQVIGKRGGAINFQPKLPPFYILDGTVRPCLTYFLKVVYTVEEFGVQPLHYLEVVCVPNGLLVFDGQFLARTHGLLTPGKDKKDKAEHTKRTRVNLDPLASIDGWRCQKIMKVSGEWKVMPRLTPAASPDFFEQS